MAAATAIPLPGPAPPEVEPELRASGAAGWRAKHVAEAMGVRDQQGRHAMERRRPQSDHG
jgi:hypothetical protein